MILDIIIPIYNKEAFLKQTLLSVLTHQMDGIEVICYGNREGEATKTLWKDGDYCYSVVAIGAGGDSDFGLSPEDLAIIVSGTN